MTTTDDTVTETPIDAEADAAIAEAPTEDLSPVHLEDVLSSEARQGATEIEHAVRGFLGAALQRSDLTGLYLCTAKVRAGHKPVEARKVRIGGLGDVEDRLLTATADAALAAFGLEGHPDAWMELRATFDAAPTEALALPR